MHNDKAHQKATKGSSGVVGESAIWARDFDDDLKTILIIIIRSNTIRTLSSSSFLPPKPKPPLVVGVSVGGFIFLSFSHHRHHPSSSWCIFCLLCLFFCVFVKKLVFFFKCFFSSTFFAQHFASNFASNKKSRQNELTHTHTTIT